MPRISLQLRHEPPPYSMAIKHDWVNTWHAVCRVNITPYTVIKVLSGPNIRFSYICLLHVFINEMFIEF